MWQTPALYFFISIKVKDLLLCNTDIICHLADHKSLVAECSALFLDLDKAFDSGYTDRQLHTHEIRDNLSYDSIAHLDTKFICIVR